MEAFIAIRKEARDRRDKALAIARDEYAAVLARIAALEQDLLGRDPSTHRTVFSCVNQVIPSDQPFSTTDIIAALEGLDPARSWRKRAIDSAIARLRERGAIRRLSRARGIEPAHYVRVGVHVEPLPFEGKTMPEVMCEVLRGKSMTQTELTMAMLDAGYQTTMKPKGLRDAVGVVLRGDQGRFVRRGERWSAST